MSLYVVATPIGNLEDISARALKVLAQVDMIAAEDTRHSRTLLQHFAISAPLVSYHDHNESRMSESLVQKMLAGLDVALISDAGTPLISDPGYRLVKLARERGIDVIPIPGASAMLAALSVSGLPTDRFRFEGFLPTKNTARLAKLETLRQESATLVFFVAPHRVEAMLGDLLNVFGGSRLATIAREMTKKFEQSCYGRLDELLDQVQSGEIVNKGEFVIVVAGNGETVGNFDEVRLMELLTSELPPRKAANLAHKLTGSGKKHFYTLALSLKGQ